MSKVSNKLAAILVVAGAVAPGAQAPSPQTLSYEDAARIALSDNPDLAALRLQSESLDLRSTQALMPNNPVLTYNQNDNYRGATAAGIPANGHASSSLALTMTVGFPGKALANSAALRHQSKAAGEAARAKELDVLAALQANYVALSVNARMNKFFTEALTKAQELVKLLERKYSTAQAAQTDLLNARVAVATLSQSLLVNRDERDILITQFRNLIKKPESRDLLPRVPDEIAIPAVGRTEEELLDLMRQYRHQLRAAGEGVQAAEATLTNISLSPLPDFQLSVARNSFNIPRASPIDDSVLSDVSFGVGVSIPIFFPFSELSNIRAARRDRDVARAQEESQRLQAVSDLKTAYTHFVAVGKEIENLRDLVVPTAKSAYELMLVTFSLGKADFFRLNDARTTYIEAQKTLLTKKADAAQTYSQLIQQVGCDFNRSEGPYACR